MNRNTNSHFANTPTVNIGRSKFDRSFTHKTTFNTGDLIPFFIDTTIMPGDTVKMSTSEVVRMMTPIAPVMDNANLDTYFFFVPYRLIWEHFKEFFGENDETPWTQQTEYEIPQIIAPQNGWKKGSLADYFGYPTKIGGYKASALPFRAYAKIWNDWFRDQNLKNPCYIHLGDADITGTDKTTLGSNYDYVTDTEKGAAPCKVAKYHDLFTSCLPEPQKGPSVAIPIGENAPVIGTDDVKRGSVAVDENLVGKPIGAYRIPNSSITALFPTPSETTQNIDQQDNTIIGLQVDLSSAVGATVNQLRQAFAIQKYYEKLALYGSRYIEFVRGMFNVTIADYRVQRSEYLGGKSIPINMNQVIQTDATRKSSYYEDNTWLTEDTTPQGNTAAYSLTTDREDGIWTHSFQEHGILMGLTVVRQVHTYQQGLNRMFSKKGKLDFYVPVFANLGNEPIYNKEIYLDGTDDDEEVFGYQEAWANERFMPDIVTGEMRSNYDQSLDIWHWADYYETRPTLSSEWIDETSENIQRTLAVQNHDQFFGDFFFKATYTRPMPLYSVPGLIDHH